MPRENPAAKSKRALDIIRRLKTAYPNAHCELHFSNPLQLLVATILSAQCTDKRVNLVTPSLFQKYRAAQDYAAAPTAALEADIKSTGFFRNKARSIQGACRALVEKHAGQVPPDMASLVQLPGVGRKTANVVLGNAFGLNQGIVVDTHVARLAKRLALSANTDPEKIEADLQKLVPQPDWSLVSHLLIWHGRRRCGARRPDCPGCEVKNLCPTGRKI
ncbi:MAG TPA: endonuclease III [Candidatus Acidoferrum sp.]|nr:endonuclease III [Candidatus Acidoferrum sp.]